MYSRADMARAWLEGFREGESCYSPHPPQAESELVNPYLSNEPEQHADQPISRAVKP